jgi:hypothetical protein
VETGGIARSVLLDYLAAGLVFVIEKSSASILVKRADLQSNPVVTFLSLHGAHNRGMSG